MLWPSFLMSWHSFVDILMLKNQSKNYRINSERSMEITNPSIGELYKYNYHSKNNREIFLNHYTKNIQRPLAKKKPGRSEKRIKYGSQDIQ